MAPTRFVYEVTGRSRFPIDMLRYDAAHPERESDSARITGTLWPNEPLNEPVTVTVVSAHMPTRARWASFGWRVGTVVETRNVGTVKERTVRHESPVTLGM
jgi:hypothetical protein